MRFFRRTWDPRTDADRRRRPAPGALLSQPSVQMVAFTEGSILLGVLLGAAIRTRIYFASPLRPDHPVLWGAKGLLQDLAIFALAGAATLFSTRFFWQRRSWSALTGFILACCALHLVWSEVVIFFGHAVRARDLQVGLKPVLLLRSVRLSIFLTSAVVVVISWILIRQTARRARKTRRTWATASRLLILGLASSGISFLPVKIHGGETAQNPVVALGVLIRNWPPTDAEGHFLVPKPALPDVALRDLAPEAPARDYFDSRFPLAYHEPIRSRSAPSLPEGLLPNVVFFVMEGVRSEELGAYGGKIPDLSPHLDALARRGIRVDRFYSNGNHTPEGELAFWYGLLPSPYEVLMTTRPELPMTGLPEILRAAGWKSFFWIHNGDQNFYRRNLFYLPRGFRTIDGRDFPSDEPRTNWGYSDRALARRALAALDNTVEPFAAMVLTVSNHHPFQLPSDAQTDLEGLPLEKRGFIRFGRTKQIVGIHTVPMLRTIHYTDEALGLFIHLARRRPWFARTIFVITSDHGMPIAPLAGLHTMHRLIEIRHRIPLIFFSPLLPAGKVVSGPGSQVDLLPTLLGLLGIRGDRAGVGGDLLDPDSADPERPVITWTREARTITLVTQRRIYHARLFGENAFRQGMFEEETMIDPIKDPEGEHDRSQSEPEAAARFRRIARAYLDVYPWVLVHGRSGLPAGRSKAGVVAVKR